LLNIFDFRVVSNIILNKLKMIITKSGDIQEVNLNKVTEKIKNLSDKLNGNSTGVNGIDYVDIAIKTVNGIFDGITTNELDKLSEKHASSMITQNYMYDSLASRIFVSNLHDNTYSEIIKVYGFNSELYKNNMISKNFAAFIELYHDQIQPYMNYEYDFDYDYMGITTLSKSYLLKINNVSLVSEKHIYYDIQQKYYNKEITLDEAKSLVKIRMLFKLSNSINTNLNIDKYCDIMNKILFKSVLRNKNSDITAERPIQMLLRVAYQVSNFAMQNLVSEFNMQNMIGSNTQNTSEFNTQNVEKLNLNNLLFDLSKSNFIDMFLGMCKKMYIHATPTLFNSGTNISQLASCFLQYCDDSALGITKVMGDSAIISKSSGGIGIYMGDVRCKGSYIKGTGGYSDGIVPFNKILNDIGRAFNQGGGKRKGSIVIYIDIYHPDIFEVLESRMDSNIDENLRCKDLFLGLWVCDLFMKTMKDDGDWYLMDPNVCVGLSNVFDSNLSLDLSKDRFEDLYMKYVNENKYVKKVKARELFASIAKCCCETGMPYILFKDHCNNKSNQKNLGVIKQSNLCAEIIEYTDTKETAVCNLGNMGLGYIMKESIESNSDLLVTNKSEFESKESNFELKFYLFRKHIISSEKNLIEFHNSKMYENIVDTFLDKLYYYTKIITENLDNVIDVNYYPTAETKFSNFKNRPIGIGIQGLQDVFILLGLEFTSEKARKLNTMISAYMYYASVEKSYEIATVKGSYESIKDSPISKGILQPHMWGMTTEELNILTPKLDWNLLINKVTTNGGCIRNSLLIALAPTQSTSHILGSTECFEPLTQIMYAKETLSGNFQIFNKYFQQDMIYLGLWDHSNNSNVDKSEYTLREKIILDSGSISNLINEIPTYIRNIYKTIWEIKPTDLVQMDADRGRFVCQSQSSNRYVEKPTTSKLYTIILKAWELGLKTAIYYTRSKPATSGIKFSIDKLSTKVDKLSTKVDKLSADKLSMNVKEESESKESKESESKESKEIKFRKWLEDSKKKAESGDCTACQ